MLISENRDFFFKISYFYHDFFKSIEDADPRLMLERCKRLSLETFTVFHFAVSILSIRQLCLVI